jgi:hypothetical protein
MGPLEEVKVPLGVGKVPLEEVKVPLGVGRVPLEEVRAPFVVGRAVEGKRTALMALVLRSCAQVWVGFPGVVGLVLSLVPPPVVD